MIQPLWQIRDCRLWFWGDALAHIGRTFGTFCFPLLVLLETNSSSLAGAIQSATLLVGALILVPAGLVADSMNRRRGAILFGVMHAALMVALVVLLALDLIGPTVLAAFAIGVVLVATPLNLCVDAMVKGILPPEQLPAASAAE